MALNHNILSFIAQREGRKEKTIRNAISLLRRKYSMLPINSVAQIYALQNGYSILPKLTSEEKQAIPILDIEKPTRIKRKISSKKKDIIRFITYNTTDYFIKAHVDEVNACYSAGCYTAAFILCRKIIENLLTDIVKRKYPQRTVQNLDLYFDKSRGRSRDFSEIISNLRKRTEDFGPDKILLERILSKSKQFKDDANNKTHSWYHIVKTRHELDDTNVQDLLQMLSIMEKNL